MSSPRRSSGSSRRIQPPGSPRPRRVHFGVIPRILAAAITRWTPAAFELRYTPLIYRYPNNWRTSVIHAALAHLHPAQDEFVFAGLGPAQGPGAVVGISLLLDRLDALESSPDRTSTMKEDHAALATLAKRGIDAGVRKHLRALIKDAQRAALPATVPASPPPDEQAREQALEQLYVWYKDWSETAHALIHRRDYLILLGLAQRHSQQEPEAAVVPAPVPNPEPAPVAGA